MSWAGAPRLQSISATDDGKDCDFREIPRGLHFLANFKITLMDARAILINPICAISIADKAFLQSYSTGTDVLQSVQGSNTLT